MAWILNECKQTSLSTVFLITAGRRGAEKITPTIRSSAFGLFAYHYVEFRDVVLLQLFLQPLSLIWSNMSFLKTN